MQLSNCQDTRRLVIGGAAGSGGANTAVCSNSVCRPVVDVSAADGNVHDKAVLPGRIRAQQHRDNPLLAFVDFACRKRRERNAVTLTTVIFLNGEFEAFKRTRFVIRCNVAVAVAYENIGGGRRRLERKRENRLLARLDIGVVSDAVGNPLPGILGRESHVYLRYGKGARNRVRGINCNIGIVVGIGNVEVDVVCAVAVIGLCDRQSERDGLGERAACFDPHGGCQ